MAHLTSTFTWLDAGWRCTMAATALLALVVGSRSAFGLFLSPINTATGLGLGMIGFAAAVGQLGQGLAQPLVGMLASRLGATRVIVSGAIGLAATTALITSTGSALVLTCLILAAGIAGTATGSVAMLVGEVAKRVRAERQGVAIGIVGAGGPVGQLLLGPLTQQAFDMAGWIVALWLTAALSLLALPLSMAFHRPVTAGQSPHLQSLQADPAHDAVAAHDAAADTPAAERGHVALRQALRTPAFWLISGGFAICGFHMSFLTMHMPGVIERCGLPASLAGTWLAVLGLTNVAGSVAVGLVLARRCPATLLAALHALRALFIACLLVLPATPIVMFGFAVAMGATYTAALPPTTTLVTRTFGAGGIATLFGVVMLIHQVGSFAGVWLGGLMAEAADGYRAIWLLEIALALIASALYLPLRPARSAEFGGFKQALQG